MKAAAPSSLQAAEREHGARDRRLDRAAKEVPALERAIEPTVQSRQGTHLGREGGDRAAALKQGELAVALEAVVVDQKLPRPVAWRRAARAA